MARPRCKPPYNKTPIAIVALIRSHILCEMVMSAPRCTMPQIRNGMSTVANDAHEVNETPAAMCAV